MADLVTDISLVAGWDPRFEESPAEVFIYTKITPQPAAKVSLLHLQSLVIKTTLLRIIPLLPDGSSPRESPGVCALGIPVVAGRNRTTLQKLGMQRRVGKITLDGVGSAGDASDSSDGEDKKQIRKVKLAGERETDRLTLKQVEGPGSLFTENGQLMPDSSPGDFGILGEFNDSIKMETTSLKKFDMCGMYSLSDFRRRDRSISYSRDASGNFKPTDCQNIYCHSDEFWSPVGLQVPEKHRVFSISSVQRDLSPMADNMLERILRLNVPGKDTCRYAGGHDGASEDLEALSCSRGAATGITPAVKERSPTKKDGRALLEDEMVKQVASETGGSGGFKSEETKMIIEKDTLFICFPGNIRGDAVVVEIVLEIKPLYLEGKSYVTFIFAGLPYCNNGAHINFRINDRDCWTFNTFPEIDSNINDSEENKFRGILDLTRTVHPIVANRTLIIRALRHPMVLEVLKFGAKTNINMEFLWSPVDDQITAVFEINVVFLGLELDDDAKFCLINLFLVNCPQEQDGIIVDSLEGTPTEFILEDADFKNHEVGAHNYRLLRVERPTKDAHQPLRIRFNKQLVGTKLQEIGIPIVRVGGKATLIEETATITKPRLPLEVEFSPNSLAWRGIDNCKQSEGKIFFLNRTWKNMNEVCPSILISCLNPAMPKIAGKIDRAFTSDDRFIDRVNYEIQESETLDNRGMTVLAVRMNFGVVIHPGMETMGEIVRIHTGNFILNYATIDGKLAGKGVFFEDSDELLSLNYGMTTLSASDKDGGERLMINIEWFGEHRLKLSSEQMVEFRLPRVLARVVGRTEFECGNRKARIVSRSQNFSGSDSTSGFSTGKVIISVMDTNKNEIFFQIPWEREHTTPETPADKLSSKNSPQMVMEGSSTSSINSMSITSFYSTLDECFEAPPDNPEKSENSMHNVGEMASSDSPTSYRIRNTKEIVIIIMMIGFLCFNLGLQSSRNSALKDSLHHTKLILEEREVAVGKMFSKNLPPYFLSQKVDGGSDDLWWDVVGNGKAEEVNYFTIGEVATGGEDDSPTYDTMKLITNFKQTEDPDKQDTFRETPLVVETAVEVTNGRGEQVVSASKDWEWKKYKEDHLKRVTQILLEEETLGKKTQRIMANIFRFFWSLAFGV